VCCRVVQLELFIVFYFLLYFVTSTKQYYFMFSWRCYFFCTCICSIAYVYFLVSFGNSWLRRTRESEIQNPEFIPISLGAVSKYDVTIGNHVANWKLGQDKTRLSSHHISRLEETVSKFSVLTCRCRRCELAITQTFCFQVVVYMCRSCWGLRTVSMISCCCCC